jgi:adenosine/AMP kinase
MHLTTVTIQKPEEMNFILGQSHFIKTVEDIHEAIVTTLPGARFGLAFCEASGKCLVRSSGTDPELGEGWYPVNVLNTIKMVPEVCHIFCASANPTEVIVAESPQGRGILGVIDGSSPLGIEDAEDVAWRKGFLRMIGYKA